MNDLDNSLKRVARSVVADAPPAPSFSSLRVGPLPVGPRRGYVIATAAAAALIASVATAAVLGRPERGTQIEASSGQKDNVGAYSCSAEPPLRIAPAGPPESPRDGPAPGGRQPVAGQRVVHWLQSDGSIELRWPAEPRSIYAIDDSRVSTPLNSGIVSPDRLEIEVHPRGSDRAPAAIEPDLIVEPHDSAPQRAPCDLVEVTVVTTAGRWVAGFRSVSRENQFYELVDLQPRIIERRTVEVAPRTATPCQGSEQHGTPSNRSGGADRSIRGNQPAEVLLAYLAANSGAVPSGYVEMKEADGSITYGVDPSGIGWTTLLWLASDGEGWYLEGWTASGC